MKMAWVTLILGLVMVSGFAKAAEIPFQGESKADILANLDGHPNEDLIRELLTNPAATPEIALFEHDGYQGGSIRLTQSDMNIHQRSFGDKTSSVIVTGSSVWVLWNDSNFQGSQYNVVEGGYPKASYWGGGNDKVSSVQKLT
ncbi:beta/gamma-crystallin-like [Amphiura filiformis]|uniref:beta/gamma-crystallin-like n=1 Tax=Amphiura filiformis TaxID=82378 RepID=UPI003B221AD2